MKFSYKNDDYELMEMTEPHKNEDFFESDVKNTIAQNIKDLEKIIKSL